MSPLSNVAAQARTSTMLFVAVFASLASMASASAAELAAHTAAQQQSSMKMLTAELRRMDSERQTSIAELTRSLTAKRAFQILEKANASSELLSVVKQVAFQRHGMHQTDAHQFLGLQAKTNPYSGMDKAREMLNDMLNEVLGKYDAETQRCSGFFEQQCSLMETCRQDIAAANEEAAQARQCILACQAEINYAERELPRLRHELDVNNRICAEKIGDLRESIQIVLDDIAVMDTVLNMTDCDAKAASFVQNVRAHVNKIKSAGLKRSVLASLKTLAGEEPTDVDVGFQPGGENFSVTNFTNPPVPETEVPPDPCSGISFDDAAVDVPKCSIASNPNCYKLQGKFLDIMAGIEEKRDELLAELAETERICKEKRETLESQIRSTELHYQKYQTDLARCTEEENVAGEQGRMKGEEHTQLQDSMFSTRQECSTNMRTFESEECALKKIRGELFKIKGDENPAFTDCQVSEWQPQECSVSCGGGTQILQRQVMQQPLKGAECPALEAVRACNLEPCPTDCEVGDWTGWSRCSADCGGGVKQRTRPVTVQPKFGGEPCGEISETSECNVQSCDKDCELSDWGAWSECSKNCAGGIRNRSKTVLEDLVGQGTCPSEIDPERHEEESCNEQPCNKIADDIPLSCKEKLDVVLVLDGSTSMDEAGWNSTKHFAKTLVSAFQQPETQVEMSLILFSGPLTWSSYLKCTGTPDPADPVDEVATCGINTVQHFTADLEGMQTTIDGLEWPKGNTLTDLALGKADAELILSRPDAPAVVVLVSDGLPMRPDHTKIQADKIKNKARFVVVPVQSKGLDAYGLSVMAEFASYPKVNNIIDTTDFEVLGQVSTVDKIIADICPGNPCANFCGMTNIKDLNPDWSCGKFKTEEDCVGKYYWMESSRVVKPCHYVNGMCTTDKSRTDWVKDCDEPKSYCK